MFDFNEIIDRKGTQSLKWDKYAERDILPLWVADTDFKAPPAILEALHKRIDHGIFGYSRPSARLIELIIDRMKTRYDWDIKPEWIIFMPGVVPALNFACRAWCRPEKKVISPIPVYYPFLHAPENNQRTISHVPMQLVENRWLPDFSRLEELARQADLLLLCNPHNPGGTVYTRAELEQIASIAERHDLIVCSDEIHCDLLLDPDARHIPFASLSAKAARRSAVLMAPSKTFNIPGLCCSFAIIPDATLRNHLQRSMQGLIADNNLLGLVAAEAAYAHCDPWLQSQLGYLRENRDLLLDRLGNIPGVKISKIEATYLAWIDVSEFRMSNPIACFEEAGVGLSPGTPFGDPGFVRLNFGCSRALLETAIDRIILVLNHHSKR